MTEIVKVQVPLNVAGAPWCMIYDKERKRATEQDVTRVVRRALKDDPKGYFEATWNEGRGYWTLGRRVEDQPW